MGSRLFPSMMSIEADANGGQLPNFCDFYETSHKSRKTKEWISPECPLLHAEMMRLRDDTTQSGAPLTQEAISTTILGKRKDYLREFGVGPKPSSSSKSDYELQIHESELQTLKLEIKALREERERVRKEREREQEEREKEKEREQEEQEREKERERESEKQRERQQQQREREEQQARCEKLSRQVKNLQSILARILHNHPAL